MIHLILKYLSHLRLAHDIESSLSRRKQLRLEGYARIYRRGRR